MLPSVGAPLLGRPLALRTTHRPSRGSTCAWGRASRGAVPAAAAGGPPFRASDVPVEDFFSSSASPPAPYDLWQQHTNRTDRVLREVDAMQKQMDRDFAGAMARAEQLAQRAAQQGGKGREVVVERGDGWRTYSRESSFEQRTQGEYTRGYFSEQVTVLAPQPAPLAQPPAYSAGLLPSMGLLLAAFLAGAWAAATRAFARGYDLTSFSEGRRWQLLLLWPFPLLVSPDFRQQFWMAVRGRRAAPQGSGAGAEGPGSTAAAVQ